MNFFCFSSKGIGKITALECARRHAHVYMVCRDEKRGKEVQEEIIQETKNANVELHLCDLAQPQDVMTFAKKFVQSQKPLTVRKKILSNNFLLFFFFFFKVLCNNAGCMINERQMINNEHEANFATNTLGVYILTKVLIPVLTQNQPARVFTTSSGGMYNVKLDPDDFNSTRMRTFSGDLVYAQNKRQQVVMAERFAAQQPSIYFATWHPGLIFP